MIELDYVCDVCLWRCQIGEQTGDIKPGTGTITIRQAVYAVDRERIEEHAAWHART